eukprot:SAG11_NODE_19145_length_473_cov_0.965241_1_plen_152_part_10
MIQTQLATLRRQLQNPASTLRISLLPVNGSLRAERDVALTFVCPKGKISSPTGACQPCPLGEYTQDRQSCRSCPEGQTNTKFGDGCECSTGFYNASKPFVCVSSTTTNLPEEPTAPRGLGCAECSRLAPCAIRCEAGLPVLSPGFYMLPQQM